MKLKPIVFYFHGYGSSPTTDKVVRLREAGFLTYAFPIAIEPVSSILSLTLNIQSVLLEMTDREHEPVCVGTSLGGWYAAKLAGIFQMRSIIINPSIRPNPSLLKYDVAKAIVERYTPMQFSRNAKYFIGNQDEVFDFTDDKPTLDQYDTTYVDADHRFNGPEFDLVIDHLNKLNSQEYRKE